MKVLVDSQSGEIQGVYNSPLNFSVSGKYIVNVPTGAGSVPMDSNDPLLLIAAKKSALMALHPTLPQSFSDEFLDISLVDQTLSLGIVAAPNKGTFVMPGGVLMTDTMLLTVPILTRVSVTYDGFLLNRNVEQTLEQPDPASLLYGWDPGSSSFVDFGSGIFQVDIMDLAGAVVLVPSMQSGLEYLYANPTPLSVRLRFTNLSMVPWHLSDYLLLAG